MFPWEYCKFLTSANGCFSTYKKVIEKEYNFIEGNKLESREVVITKMSSNKRSGNNLSDENEKVSKQRCSLTGYSEKTIADFFEDI